MAAATQPVRHRPTKSSDFQPQVPIPGSHTTRHRHTRSYDFTKPNPSIPGSQTAHPQIARTFDYNIVSVPLAQITQMNATIAKQQETITRQAQQIASLTKALNESADRHMVATAVIVAIVVAVIYREVIRKLVLSAF